MLNSDSRTIKATWAKSLGSFFICGKKSSGIWRGIVEVQVALLSKSVRYVGDVRLRAYRQILQLGVIRHRAVFYVKPIFLAG
jgi:hypothetical protein